MLFDRKFQEFEAKWQLNVTKMLTKEDRLIPLMLNARVRWSWDNFSWESLEREVIEHPKPQTEEEMSKVSQYYHATLGLTNGDAVLAKGQYLNVIKYDSS